MLGRKQLDVRGPLAEQQRQQPITDEHGHCTDEHGHEAIPRSFIWSVLVRALSVLARDNSVS
jgi:hypothetical protein